MSTVGNEISRINTDGNTEVLKPNPRFKNYS